MENLLKQLYLISKEYKMLADREEKFNIFSALHKMHDERRLHSRFLSVLLQPKGSHGFGDKFLDLFLKEVSSSGVYMDTKSSEEDDENEEMTNDKKEKTTLHTYTLTDNTIVYPTEKDKKENNDIDILIIDRIKKQCVIIENKIYAGDSQGGGGHQLQRYIDHVVTKEKIPIDNIAVIYLTLGGHGPSEESVGAYYGKKDIILCSYQESIISWLENCLKETAKTPFLRESILQYIKLLKKMITDNSSVEERKSYRNLVGESEANLIAARKLYVNFKHMKWHSVHDFWLGLQKNLIEKKYVILKKVINEDGSSQVIKDLTHYEDYRKGQKNKQKCFLNFQLEEGLPISIRFTPNGGFYFGVSANSELSPKIIEKLEKMMADNSIYQKTTWMLINKKFDKQIIFNDFNKESTFDLINPDKNKILMEDAWKEIELFIETYSKL